MIAIRYLVNDVTASTRFYTENFGFRLDQQYGTAMAILSRDGVGLWLAGPLSSAAQTLQDSRQPEPGGWNRLVLSVDDLARLVEKLKGQGVSFCHEVRQGPGGAQALCEDPSGNKIELFQERQDSGGLK